MICPVTCAPMSIRSSGSIVPVARIVCVACPRVKGTVLYATGASAGRGRASHHAAPPPANATKTTTVNTLFMLSSMKIPDKWSPRQESNLRHAV